MLRKLLTALLFLAVYCGLELAALIPATSLNAPIGVWAATGLLIAVLLHANHQQWPAYLAIAALGSVLSGGVAGLAPALVAVTALAHAGEAWIAAMLLRRRKRRESDLLREWLADSAAIGIVAPMAGALCVATAASLSGAGNWQASFAAYALAHSLGNLLFFPLLNLIVGGQLGNWLRRLSTWQRLELAGLAAAVAFAGSAALFQQSLLPYLAPILLTLVATYRFGMPATSLAIVALSVGPLAAMTAGSTLEPPLPVGIAGAGQFLHFYLFAAMLCLQPLARHITQNRRLVFNQRENERSQFGKALSLEVKDFAIGETQSLYRLLAENVTDIVLKTDHEGHVLYASPSIRLMNGLHPTELLGRHVAELVHPSYDASFMATHAEVIETGEDSAWAEYLGLSGGGEEQWFDTRMRAVRDMQGKITGVVSIMRSIEERKVLEQQLFAATLTDPLTNLTNRRAFNSMLQYHIDVPIDGCLAMFDIDDFRSINRDHGHDVGDKVLTTVAKLLRALLRKEDIISRIGGERFAVLLSRATADQAEVLCQRIVTTLSDMSGSDGLGGGPKITVSAGVARIEGTLDDTMKRADSAVVVAKAKGRNRLEVATRGQRRWSPAEIGHAREAED